MVTKHMEVSDRGVTLSKGLAWTVVTGLVAAAFWLGSEMRHTQTTLEGLVSQQAERHAETMSYRRDIEQQAREQDRRIRVLEAARQASTSEMTALRRDLTGFRQDMRDLKELIEGLQEALRRQ